jgi:large subunit ribosomal protein L32
MHIQNLNIDLFGFCHLPPPFGGVPLEGGIIFQYMGLPAKRRTSRSKKERAAHFALSHVQGMRCPACGAAILPHRACQSCGEYRGRKVTNVAKRVERKLRKSKKAK